MRKLLGLIAIVCITFLIVAGKPTPQPMQITYWDDHDAPRGDTWCDGQIGDDDWFRFRAEGDLAAGQTFSVTSPRPTCLWKLVRTQYQHLGKKPRAPKAIEVGVIDPLGVFHPVELILDRKDRAIAGYDCFSTNFPSKDEERLYHGYYTWLIYNPTDRAVNVQLSGYLQEDEYNQGCEIGW